MMATSGSNLNYFVGSVLREANVCDEVSQLKFPLCDFDLCVHELVLPWGNILWSHSPFALPTTPFALPPPPFNLFRDMFRRIYFLALLTTKLRNRIVS